MRVSLDTARRLLTARGYKVGPVLKKAPVLPAARALAKAKREHYEIGLGLQLDRAGIVYERQRVFLENRAFRADFAILDARLLIEVDGGSWLPYSSHGRGGYEKDRVRDAEAMVAGWRVLRVTCNMVTNGQAIAFIQRIISSLERQGHPSLLVEGGGCP